jgi:lysophospholipase L1-like esterase
VDRREFIKAAVVTAGVSVGGSGGVVAAQGARAAATTAPVGPGVPEDVVWHDVREWGVEGRGFEDTERYFDRLPGRAKGVVRDAVWSLSRHTSGMKVFFEADAAAIYVRYKLTLAALAMAHMPATGVSGVDLYGRVEGGGWRWVGTHQPKAQAVEAAVAERLAPGRRSYHLNLPLYNGVASLEIGVRKGAAFEPVAPRKARPIVFYGTSITQGGCASRPGMSFTNILGRRLDRPVLNFGFSGNGKTEVEVARFLAEVDAAAFVLDTSANTSPEELRERAPKVVKLWREKHPGVPILMLDERVWESAPLVPHLAELHRKKTEALKGAYEELAAAGVKGVRFRKGDDLLKDDGEATVDGSHPNDLGMMRYAEALEGELRGMLGG